MNHNKRLKPKLLDPILQKKIIKTLKPPKEDYWAPTKNVFQIFYQDYIKPNIYLILFIILICILLLYRYRMTQREREKNNTVVVNHYHTEPTKNSVDTNILPELVQNQTVNTYTDIVMNAYNQQKEDLREPLISRKETDSKGPKFAYPMYPYAKGGTLTPSTKR